MIQNERIKELNKKNIKNGDYVLYWMHSSHRINFNHALQYSILKANKLNKPLIVFFGLTNTYPNANLRHYTFLLEGIKEVQRALNKIGVKMVIFKESPEKGVLNLSKGASLVVMDRGYLKIHKQWTRYCTENIDCPLIQIESNVIVPVESASQKEEFSAGTFRPKIASLLDYYLFPLDKNKPDKTSIHMDFNSLELDDIQDVLSHLNINQNVKPVTYFKGGESEANRKLNEFIENKLNNFHNFRNDPSLDYTSNMSPYLHFGQISPLKIALKIIGKEGLGKESYLEELIIRRELSMNLVTYNSSYDSFDVLPDWVKLTLEEHKEDFKEYVYSLKDFENSNTHDPYWNAAQNEMKLKGKMHGYMRMYWAKKILEWAESSEVAYKIAINLNDKYELDGRDPNGYAGVAWCFGKHDRAWSERPIFGKVRYMNSNGLKRKFKIDQYVENVAKL